MKRRQGNQPYRHVVRTNAMRRGAGRNGAERGGAETRGEEFRCLSAQKGVGGMENGVKVEKGDDVKGRRTSKGSRSRSVQHSIRIGSWKPEQWPAGRSGAWRGVAGLGGDEGWKERVRDSVPSS